MSSVLPPEKNNPDPPRQLSPWLSILSALVVAGMVAVVTFVLVSPLLVIVPLFAAAVWIQYLVWGRWLENYYAEYRAELEEQENRKEE